MMLRMLRDYGDAAKEMADAAAERYLGPLKDKDAFEQAILNAAYDAMDHSKLFWRQNNPKGLGVFCGAVIACLGWLWGSREKAV